MDLKFEFYKKNVPIFYLVFFCLESRYITRLKFKSEKNKQIECISKEYFDVIDDILRTSPKQTITGLTHNIILNFQNKKYNFEVSYNKQTTNSALCVDLLMPTNNTWMAVSENNKIFASTTIFLKNQPYHLLDHAVAGKQDLSSLKREWNFNSYGCFTCMNHSFCSKQIPVCALQEAYLKLIDEYLKNVNNLTFECANDVVKMVKTTPYHLNNRMYFAVLPMHFLKHVPYPKKPVFGACTKVDECEKLEWVVNTGYFWIYNSKHFSREFHDDILISAWKSLFLQDCGNCLDMGITMYQILMSYFPTNQYYTFGLASVLVDNMLPHCVCVMIPKKPDYGKKNNSLFGRKPFIVDSTRTIDQTFHFNSDYVNYCNITYKYITGIYTMDNCFWVVEENSANSSIIKLNVTVEDFLQNKYDIIQRYHVSEDELKLLKYAYMYEI